MKTTQKSQKPISIDAHFKYRCTNSGCSIEHWVSLKEAKIKNFKVVCDCGAVFKPKQISKISILYKKKKITPKDIEPVSETTPVKQVETNRISESVLEKSSQILCIYGFTEKESKEYIVEAYSKVQTDDVGKLVKIALESLGGKNV